MSRLAASPPRRPKHVEMTDIRSSLPRRRAKTYPRHFYLSRASNLTLFARCLGRPLAFQGDEQQTSKERGR
ncbi:unnamed protein product [Merluccius merluccius]